MSNTKKCSSLKYTKIIEIVIQGIILDKVSGFELLRFDIDTKTNYKKLEFHLGFATDPILSDLKRQVAFDRRVINKFYINVLLCVKVTFRKSTRHPLISVVADSAMAFKPSVILQASKDILNEKIENTSSKFDHLSQIIPGTVGDKAYHQCSEFLVKNMELLQLDDDRLDCLD